MRQGWLVVTAGLFAVGCGPKAETPEQMQARIQTESAAARQAIEAANAEFMKHFNLGHGDIVAKMYTEDAHLMIVNSPVAVGREQIAAMLKGDPAMKTQLTLKTEDVVANGPIAVERGSYTLTVSPPGASAPATENGTYLVHWHRVDGKWLLKDDIGTSDKPLPPPPQAPAK